jgi:hypothetical protein
LADTSLNDPNIILLDEVAAAHGETKTSVPAIAYRDAKGIALFLNISAVGGTPTIDVKLQAYNEVSDSWIDVPGAAFPQKTGTGLSLLTVYPGIAAVANVAVSQVLPHVFQVVAVIGNAGGDTATFTVSGVIIP